MRTIATIGDLYGPDAGATFYNANNGVAAGLAGTTTSGGDAPDFAGGGTQTAAAIQPIQVLTNLRGTLWGNGVVQWFLIAGAVIGIYSLAKRHVSDIESDLAVPRVSIPAFLSIGVQAFLFFVLVKTLLKKYNIPGLSGLAASA